MQNFNWSKYVFFSLAIFLLVMLLLYHSHLPGHAAVNLNTSGEADIYSNKSWILFFDYEAILLIVALLFSIILIITDSFITLPDKKFRLHESSKEQTLGTIRNSLFEFNNFTLFLFSLISNPLKKSILNRTYNPGLYLSVIIISFIVLDGLITIRDI